MDRSSIALFLLLTASGYQQQAPPDAQPRKDSHRQTAQPFESNARLVSTPTATVRATDDSTRSAEDSSTTGPPRVAVRSGDGALVDLFCHEYWDPGPVDTPEIPGRDVALGPSVHISRLWDGHFARLDATEPLQVEFEPPVPVSATLSLIIPETDSPPVAQIQLTTPAVVEDLDLTGVPAGDYVIVMRAVWSHLRIEAVCSEPARVVN